MESRLGYATLRLMQTIHIEKEMGWSVYKHRSLSLPIEIKEATEHVGRTSQTSRQMEMNKEVICVKLYQDNTRKSKVHPCTGTEALYRTYGP